MRIAASTAFVLAVSVGVVPGAAPEPYYPSDVIAQFRALSERADALGAHLNGAPEPTHCYHIQGVARTSGPGTPYLFLSQSGNHPGVLCLARCGDLGIPCADVGDGPGHIHIAKMESRERTGERLRSNRIVRGEASTADSPPDPLDRVVRTITFDGQNGWPAFGHPGGMQILGDVLAVALEHPYSAEDIAADINRILFIDIRDPENPRPLSSAPIRLVSGYSAGAIAIAPLPNGRYLMLVTGKENRLVRVYESYENRAGGGTDLRAADLAWNHVYSWRPEDNPVDPPCWSIPPNSAFPQGLSWGWPEGGWDDYAHQSYTFVREGGPSGDLYLIGARNSNALPLFGDDMLDLYRVEWDGTTLSLGCAAQKHLFSHPSADGALFFHNKVADFAAGSGVYVSPSGELIVYATEHDNDGPSSSIKMGEWRHRDMVRPESSTLDPSVAAGGPFSVPEGSGVVLTATAALPATKAWVQLWTDPNWTDDRYLVIDYPDRYADDFHDFELLDDAAFNPLADGFGDQATSARWFSPAGCLIHLNRDDVEPGAAPLPPEKRRAVGGEGEARGLSHLDDHEDDAGDDHMDDSISSVVFQSGCDRYYDPNLLEIAWDVDGDGTYEVVWPTALFSAFSLDGPTDASPGVRVRHPHDGRTGYDTASVRVTNVAPVLASFAVTDGAGRALGEGAAFALAGLPLTLTATFTDPGRPDTQAASIDWGDGAMTGPSDLDDFAHATGGLTGRVRETRAYAAPGNYSLVLRVWDDDGGETTRGLTVEVLDARGAIVRVIAELDVLIPSTSGAGRRALQNARDHLDGNQGGAGNNGAVDKLDAGDREAAVVKIREAIEEIVKAEAATGRNFSSLKASLALAAHAIAVRAQADALAAVPSPSPGQAKQLAEIAADIERGATFLASGRWIEAVEAFRSAVRRAQSLL